MNLDENILLHFRLKDQAPIKATLAVSDPNRFLGVATAWKIQIVIRVLSIPGENNGHRLFYPELYGNCNNQFVYHIPIKELRRSIPPSLRPWFSIVFR